MVKVRRTLTEKFIQKMANGIHILDTETKPCPVTMQSKMVFRIVLTQGLNRQIRRMCEYLGYEVVKLKRTRIMSVRLAGLKVGQWRDLTIEEMAEINGAVQGSSKIAV